MVRQVTWITTEKLDCEPTANVILCLATFTLDAQLIFKYEMTCPNQTAYTFSYDDDDLPSGYLDDQGPLTEKRIKGVICEDCLTQWVRDLIDFAGEIEIVDDEDASTLIPAAGPLHFIGGSSLKSTALSDGIEYELELSADANNQAVFGVDGNLFVPPVPRALDGWIDVTADGWTYASQFTINVPAGALARYSIGDRIWIVQSSTAKYFYVQAVADTLLTVNAGSDYFVLNQSIQAAYYSKIENPVGFPSYFHYTPIIHGFSVNPTLVTLFRMSGRRVTVMVRTTVSGTSNAVTFNISAPFICAPGGVGTFFSFGQGGDNNIYQSDVFAQISVNTNVIDLYRNGGAATWTASGLKSAGFNLDYLV